MKDIVFITGNQHKADYLAKYLDMPIPHQKIDLDELQSLDLREVIEHKVREAYKIIGAPVLVEDISLTFTAMGRLPGTFIKWFLQELDNDGLCELADGLPTRDAVASIMYGLYDGKTLEVFEGTTKGTIAPKPRGSGGFGWNPIFIPEGATKTYAEMVDEELMPYSHRAEAVKKLREYLKNR